MKLLLITIIALAPMVGYAKEAAKPAAAAGKTLKSQSGKGQVVFEAVGKPSFLKIKGQGEGPEGEVTIDKTVQGNFKFKMTTLNTGIGLRDSHMKEKYLQVDKYPTAELKLESVEKFSGEGATGLPFKGTLTVHGVAKPVTGTVDVAKKDAGYTVKAQFDAKITDHSIDIPSYAGVTVADSVKVTVETELL